MHDKRMQAEDDSSISVQDGDRKVDDNYVKLEDNSSENLHPQEQSVSDSPLRYYRQGYCSCCQVHYINLAKHLASDQHKDVSILHRNRFNTSTLMERFLKDVHLYHPQNYHDNRPTYDDIPEVNVISSPQEHRVYINAQANQPSVSSNTLNQPTVSSNTLSGEDKNCISDCHKLGISSKKMTYLQLRKTSPKHGGQDSRNENHHQSVCTWNNSLTTCQKALCIPINPLPHAFSYSTLPLNSTNQLTANQSFFETPHTVLSSEPSKNRKTACEKPKKCPGAHKAEIPSKSLDNRQFNIRGSYCNLTSGIVFKNENIFNTQAGKGYLFSDHVLPSDSNTIKSDEQCKGFSHLKNKETHLSRDDNSVDATIEAVIRKYCQEPSSDRIEEKPLADEESVLSLNVPSMTGCTEDSSLSFNWNVPLEIKEDQSKVMITNLDLYTESSVYVDEDYKSKLKCVLQASPSKEMESEHQEEVLPALPHIPPSFVGKTWSQVMHEDDLKIEALVKEFRKGKFHCYFEEECSVNTGSRRRNTSKQVEKKVEANTEDLNDSLKVDVLPLFEDDFCEDHIPDTHSTKSESALKSKFPKPCKHVWRQASRCQVVKVSHGTQTSIVNYPVVKRKILKNDSHTGIFDDFVEERTPDMKTKMCALKLPESYTKILTPLQPKTMVYVLSNPDIKPSTCRKSRKQFSTDSRESVYYKYKQSPLKYYDPLTNRILKTPPRNSLQGLHGKAHCVRKLFRSLSNEGNVDKVDTEPKESSTSKKSLSSCSVSSVPFESIKGKYLNSSIKGSGSSESSEYTSIGYAKLGYSEKPHAHISISPCKAAVTKVSEDTTHSILITDSKRKPLRPQKLVKKELSDSSPMQSKPVIKTRVALTSKHRPHKMGKSLEKRTEAKSRCRTQSKRNPSAILSKSKKPCVQTRYPNKRKVKSQMNERTGEEFKKQVVKSQLMSLKPTKRKRGITRNNLQMFSEDKYITRSRSKATERSLPNTYHCLRSRCTILNKSSTTRTFTNTLTRRKAR
ncbi:DBF4-type zinc finger-containing protein 2 isoform X2 [Hyperolius riggenbachi]